MLLAIRSDLFGWEIPGGTLEARESALEAVVREAREETGLDVEPIVPFAQPVTLTYWFETGSAKIWPVDHIVELTANMGL